MIDKNTKKLLHIDRSALQNLHKYFGMDFCAPYGSGCIKGRFSVGDVIKLAKVGGYRDRGGDKLAVITWDSCRPGVFEYWFIKNGFVLPGHLASNVDRNLTKGARYVPSFGSNTVEAYIVWQDQEYLKLPKEKAFDANTRYEIMGVKLDYPYYLMSDVINLKLREIGGDGTIVTYYPSMSAIIDIYGDIHYPKRLNKIIDRGGYLHTGHLDKLKNKLAKMRA